MGYRHLSALLAVIASTSIGCAETLVDPGDYRVTTLAQTTATEGWAVNYPKQPKLFFAEGLLWIFYADGNDLVVRTTSDGVTISDPAVAWERMVFGHRCALAYDGVHFHAACSEATPGADVLYRRGLPRSDGTIVWGATSVVFDVPDGQSVLYPKVLIASSGEPWAAWMLFEGGFETAPQAAMVSRSTRADGVWETAPGFPAVLTRSVTTFPDPLGVALGDGVYFVYAPDGDAVYRGRFFDDAGAGAEEDVSHSAGRHGLYAAVAEGTVLHVAYRSDAVYYRRRDADGTFTAPVHLTSWGSGHTTVAVHPRGARVTWLDRTTGRVGARTITSIGAEPAELVLDASGRGGLTGTLGINLNGLSAPAGPFREAIVVTTGATAPYELLLITR